MRDEQEWNEIEVDEAEIREVKAKLTGLYREEVTREYSDTAAHPSYFSLSFNGRIGRLQFIIGAFFSMLPFLAYTVFRYVGYEINEGPLWTEMVRGESGIMLAVVAGLILFSGIFTIRFMALRLHDFNITGGYLILLPLLYWIHPIAFGIALGVMMFLLLVNEGVDYVNPFGAPVTRGNLPLALFCLVLSALYLAYFLVMVGIVIVIRY